METRLDLWKKEMFNSQTQISEVLELHFNDVVTLTFDEFDKCIDLNFFLWAELGEAPIPQISSFYDRKAGKTKEQFAIYLLKFASKKDELMNTIKEDPVLIMNYSSFLNNRDLYIKQHSEKNSYEIKNRIFAQKLNFKWN